MNAVLLDSLVKRILKGVIEKGATKPEQLVCASNAGLTAYFSTLLNGGTRDVAERVLSSIADNFMHVAKGVKNLETGAKKVASLVYEGTQGMDTEMQKRIYNDVLAAVKKYSKGTNEDRLTGGAIEEFKHVLATNEWPQFGNVADAVDDTRGFLQWLQQQKKIVDYKFRPKAIAYTGLYGLDTLNDDPAANLKNRYYEYYLDPYYNERFGELRGKLKDTVEQRPSSIITGSNKKSAIFRDAVVDIYFLKVPGDPDSLEEALDIPVQGIAHYLDGDHKSNKQLRENFLQKLNKWASTSNPEIAEERLALRDTLTPEDVMKRILFPNDPKVLPTETSLQKALRKRLRTKEDVTSFLSPYIKAFKLEGDKWEDMINGLIENDSPVIPRSPILVRTSLPAIKEYLSSMENKEDALEQIPLILDTASVTPYYNEQGRYELITIADKKLASLFENSAPSGYTSYAGEKRPYWEINNEENKILDEIEEKMNKIKAEFINEENKSFAPLQFRKGEQFSSVPMTRAGPKAQEDFEKFKKERPDSNITAEEFLKLMGTNSTLGDVKALEEEEVDEDSEIKKVMNDLFDKVQRNKASKEDVIRLYGTKMEYDKKQLNEGKNIGVYLRDLYPTYEVGYKKFFDIYNRGSITPEEADYLLELAQPLAGYSDAIIKGEPIREFEKELSKYVTQEETEEYLKGLMGDPSAPREGNAFKSNWVPSSTPKTEERQEKEDRYEKLFGKRQPKTGFNKPLPGVKIEPIKEAPPPPMPQLPEEKKDGFWSWAKENPVPAMTLIGAIPSAVGGVLRTADFLGKAAYMGINYFKPQWADWLDAHWPGGLVKGVGHALEDIADFAPAIFRDYMEASARQDAYAVQQAQVQARNDAAMKNYEQQVSYQKYVDELKDKMTKMEIEQARKEREQKEAEIEYQRNEIRRENLYKDEEDARKERNYERQYALDQQRDKINARNFNRAEEYKREKAKYDERERQRELAFDALGSAADAGLDIARVVFAGPASAASAAASAAAAAVAPAPAAPAPAAPAAAAPVPVVPAAAAPAAAAPVPVVPAAAAPAAAAPAPPAPAAAAAAAAPAAAAPAAAAEPASKKSKKTKESTSTKSDISTGNIGKAISKGLKWYFHEAAPIEEKQEYVSQMKAKEEQQKSYKRGADLPGAGPERLVKDNIHSAPIARPVLEVAPARPADFKTTNIDAAYNRVRSRWEARDRQEEEDKAKRRAQKEEDKRTAMEFLQNFKADQEVRGDAITPVSAGRQGRALTTRLEPLRTSVVSQQRTMGKKRPTVNLRRKPSTIFPSTLPRKKQSEEPKRKRRRKK